jgi:hypothetical protein
VNLINNLRGGQAKDLSEPRVYTFIGVHRGATNGDVAGSIPDGVTGTFHWYNPSGRNIAPGVDWPSNRNEYQEYILGLKAVGA